MPGFPCDNSGDDFVGQEVYELVYEDIASDERKLGRILTEEERKEIYAFHGAPLQ